MNDFAFTPSFRRAAKTHLGAYLNAWVLSAAAWFPETPSCYTAKHPIALPKIWAIYFSLLSSSQHNFIWFYMYMLNVCLVRSLAASCNGCFSFQFECKKSTASSGHVGPWHEVSAAHSETDRRRERERETGFFSIDFVIFPQNPSEWIGQVGY